MNVLVFDTALSRGLVAVARSGRVVCEVLEDESRALAERLVPMIEDALSRAGLTYRDLDCLGVTLGPGTFTGTRIGVATARGLALASGLPVIGVSTLEALAAGAREKANPGEQIVAAIDARRGQIYQQIFEPSGTSIAAVSDPVAIDLDDAASARPSECIVVGSGAGLAQLDPGQRQLDGYEDTAAQALVTLVTTRAPAREPVRPLYLRRPDAKLPKAAVA